MRKVMVFLLLFFVLIVFSYTVRVGDTLSIEVFNQPELSRTVKVAFDGTIPYPFAGNIRVAGKTVAEIAEMLRPYAGKIVKDPLITVSVIEYAPMLVFIQGEVNKIFDISVYPGMTLTKLLSFIGISKDSINVDFENVQIKRGSTIMNINLIPYFYQGEFDNDIVLKEGDIIYLPPLTNEKIIKVTGAYTITIPYEPGIKLSDVLLKLGPLDEKYADLKNAKVYMDNQVISVDLNQVISNEYDIELLSGTKVYIPKVEEFYVYIQGYVNNKGKIEFLPDEKRTLKVLLAKAGLNEEVENEGIIIINNEKEIKVKDIIFGEKDYVLNHGDIVQVIYEPFVVNVVGLNGGSYTLLHNEPRTLSYLIKKVGISEPGLIENVQIVRNGKIQEFDINLLIYKNPYIPLEKYDTVVIKNVQEKAVYLTGDVAAYVSFSSNEQITLQRILAKVNLSDYRKIERITLDGKELDVNEDIEIPKGSILYVTLKKPIYITAMGYIKENGRVEFDYYETPDLKTLFGKLGGLIIGSDLYYTSDKVYIIRNSQIVKVLDAEKVYKGEENALLKNNDFVFVTEKEPNYVYVFGKNVPNTIVEFKSSEPFDFKTLISKIGGIQDGVSKTVTILDGASETTFTWNEYSNMNLKKGSTILFDIDTKNYVFVVDEEGKPNMFYLEKGNTSLYEIITEIKLEKAYKFIKLIRDEKEEIIDISNIEKALAFNVKPGDIIKVVDIPQNIAYVLGEVNNPGMISVNEGTTVLEAIILAGYFNDKAAPSSVFLYKGGINGEAIKVNLSKTIKGGNAKENPKVEPGDIIYVPADAFKTAIDWIPVINNLLGLYNNISLIINNQ